ncbi:hypothetical protein [Serratia ureilytica]|uniref:hypothetical protein n=1 Tax=Serratia ureilytica TaxID=300181 RepID=UPI0018664672|nr:hypothetical protein [Serratia ureilytica]
MINVILWFICAVRREGLSLNKFFVTTTSFLSLMLGVGTPSAFAEIIISGNGKSINISVIGTPPSFIDGVCEQQGSCTYGIAIVLNGALCKWSGPNVTNCLMDTRPEMSAFGVKPKGKAFKASEAQDIWVARHGFNASFIRADGKDFESGDQICAYWINNGAPGARQILWRDSQCFTLPPPLGQCAVMNDITIDHGVVNAIEINGKHTSSVIKVKCEDRSAPYKIKLEGISEVQDGKAVIGPKLLSKITIDGREVYINGPAINIDNATSRDIVINSALVSDGVSFGGEFNWSGVLILEQQ